VRLPTLTFKELQEERLPSETKAEVQIQGLRTIFMVTTATFFSHSLAKFLTEVDFIACKLNGHTLEKELLAIEKPAHT
jgi:hypothetical protein